MSDENEMNEIAAAAHEAKRVREAGDATEADLQATGAKEKKNNWPLVSIGIGLGVGSAALAAALLYARRTKD